MVEKKTSKDRKRAQREREKSTAPDEFYCANCRTNTKNANPGFEDGFKYCLVCGYARGVIQPYEWQQ